MSWLVYVESSELHSSDRIGRQGNRYLRAIGDGGSRLGSIARVAETPR